MSGHRAWAAWALACSAAWAVAAPGSDLPDGRTDIARGWSALRAMDCARCHGRDYRGQSGPSLIAAVRDGTQERFRYYVLEGDPGRGMPGYRSQPLVVAEVDAMYAYLRAASDGTLGAGQAPAGAASR